MGNKREIFRKCLKVLNAKEELQRKEYYYNRI
jgi:hypothetical protein